MKQKLFVLIVILNLLNTLTSNAQWTALTVPNSTASMKCAYFKDANNGFVAGAERIRKTNNGGATWDTTGYGIYNAYLTGCIVEGIHFVSATEGIAAGWNFWDNCEIVFKTHDGGTTWTDIRWGNTQAAFGTYLYDMHFANATTGYCVGDLGHILKSTDGGDNWAYVNSGTVNGLKGVYFTSANNGIAVGDEVILKTTNGGTSWTTQSFTGVYFNEVTFVNATTGYAVTSNSTYKTTDGGTTWNLINATVGGTDITAVNTDTIFIASGAGVFKSNNAGAQFFQQPSLYPNNNFYGIYFYNSTLGFAMNNAGKVYKTTTGGDAVQQNDGGVVSIVSLPFGSCQGVYPVQVQLKNYGQANLTQAKIDWKVNGISQTPFVWSGNLASDSTTSLFSIGNYIFGFGISNINAYTTQANSVNDYIHYNDTSTATYNFQRLSGAYTVGGVSPNYVTLDDAISALNNYGTCGNVEFKIRNGTYQPAFGYNINNFYRTNTTDSVVFQSESGDSSQVILQGFSSLIALAKTNNVSFSKLTFTLSNSGNAIAITDSANNINFFNCSFILPATGYAIAHTGKALTNLTISYCNFFRGDGGVNINTSLSTQINNGIKITNCFMDSMSTTGISVTYSKNILIQNNTITSYQAAFSAVALSNCSGGFVIDKNKMITDKGENVLSLSGYRDALNEGVVSNNFISINKSYNTLNYCVTLLNCLNIKMIYNTINCDIDAAIRIYQADTNSYPLHTFQNNIVCNRKNNVVFNWGMPAVASTNYLNKVFKDIGYNAYYNAPGGNGYYPYLFFSLGDFNDWKGFYPSDSTSVFTNPQFASYLDYHIVPNTTNILLNNKAKSLAGYTTDMDNNLRNVNPDIGCAEFNLNTVDAGVKSFAAATRICSGANAVELRVGNFGLNNITSGTVNWTVNGIAQTAFAWSGNILSGDSSSLISIGTYNFVNGNSYTIKAWMSNANSGADANHLNDTSTVTVTAKGLSGSYTIGGASPNYATFSDAVADLISNGVCSAVTFNVRNGSYQDSIAITPVAGASALNTITFQSETGDSTAVMLWNISRKVVRIDTAAYITFNQLTIVDSTLSNTQAAIYFRGSPHHITVKNCVLRSRTSGYTVWTDTKVVTDITFDHNLFGTGYTSIVLGFNNIGFYLNNNITITNNIFTDKSSDIIQIARGANVLIDHNYFHSYLYFTPSSISAIRLTGSITSKITITNNVLDLRNYQRGIDYTGNGQPNNKNLFANNMVSLLGPASVNAFALQAATNVRVVYNSGLMDSCNYTTGAVIYTPGTESEMFNNSFYNKGSGSAVYFNTVVCNSDYNNFYTDSAPAIQTYFSNYALSSWQLFSGVDAHSVSGNPQYVSQSNLHSTGSYYLNATAMPLAAIAKDIDGDARTTTPDIGADEFNLVLQANDAGINDIENPDTLCAGNHPVNVRIKNYGSATLTSAIINWTVNGVLQTPYNWSGTLASLSFSNYFSVGNYNFGALDTFNIVAWTSNPNSTTDLQLVNDTSKLNKLLTRMQGVYTIGGSNPDFSTLVIALQKIKSIGICGPVTFNLRNGSHQGPTNVINGFVGMSSTNTFTIQAESGDSTAVTIENNYSGGTLSFNAISFCVLKNLTINTWASYDGVKFDNGSNFNKVTGCILNSRLTIYYNSNHNILENNLVINEIYVTGQSTLTCYGNIIRNNTLNYNYGISCYYEDSLLVEKNTITNPNNFATNGNFGIKLLGGASHFQCIKNTITGNFSQSLNLALNGMIGDTAIIANNIVIAGNAGGIGVNFMCEYVKFVYNTFYYASGITGYPAQNAAAPFDNTLIIKNNQFITYGFDWAYYWGQITFTTKSISDYNNYYTAGADLISVGISTQYQTVAAFNVAHPSYDLHSTDVDPQFSSPNFLYPTNVLAQGTGTPVYGVNDDFNGLLRNATNPTMGALEAPPVIVDDSINKDVAIQLLNQNLSLGNNTISVQINNLKPFLIDTVYHNYIGTVDTLYLSYSINGSAPINQTWIGSLAMNDSVTINFTTPYNVPKGRLYTVFVQVALPASYNTLALNNDTATFEIGLPLAGVYTVGGSNPDFINLDEANYNYYKMHTSAACIFNIRAGLDSLFSIYQYQDNNTITFQSESLNANDVQIKIMNVYDSYNVHFKHVTLHPKTNYDYVYGYKGAEFIGSNFSIDSCIIRGLNDPDYRNGLTFVHCDSVAVTHCNFVDLDNAVNFSDYNWFGSNYFYGKCFVRNNTFDSVANCVHVLGWMTDTVYISNNRMNAPDNGIDYANSNYSLAAIINNNIVTNAVSSAMQVGSFNGGNMYYFNCFNNMLGGFVSLEYFNNLPVQFNYNSIYGTLQVYDCANYHARNNSIYSVAPNIALNFNQTYPVTSLYDASNNNYYSLGTTNIAYVFLYNGNNGFAANIADLKTLTGAETQSISADPNYTSTSDLHCNAPALNNAGVPIAGINFDIDGELRSTTLPDIGADEFNVVDSLVWPGDCNYDGVANNYDLLSIGLYFNLTGSVRASANNTWVGQPSADWGALQYCGYDKKHADCNGDGIINWSDTTAIKLNWGQTHAFKPAQLPYINSQPDLHFVSSATAYKPGDTVEVEIWAGNASSIIDSIYGISFDVAFDLSLVKAGSMTLTYNPSWIGIENNSAVTTSNIGATAAGAISRITGTDTSGYGMFAKLRFIVEPTLTSAADFILSFSNYQAITANGNLLQFNTQSDTLTINPTLSIEENGSQHFFTLYPNPATDEVTISYDFKNASHIKIELFNSIGEKIKVLVDEKQQAGSTLQGFKTLEGLSKGIYFVKMMVDGKVYAKKLVVE